MNQPDIQKPLFPKGDIAPAAYFTGDAWIRTLVSAEDNYRMVIGSVDFAAGARNHWHTHPGGQILIVTEGTGYYQEKSKPIRKLYKGDVVKILPDIKHWHGATPDSTFTHLALTPHTATGMVNWMEAVTEEEYSNFK